MVTVTIFCLLIYGTLFLGLFLGYISGRQDAANTRTRRIEELEESLTRLHKQGAARIEEIRALRGIVYATGAFAADPSDSTMENLGRALCLATDKGYLDLKQIPKISNLQR